MSVIDGTLADRISAEARQIHLGRLLAVAVAAILFGLGWTVAKTCRALISVISWSIAAVRVGWREGFAQATPPSR